MLGGWLAIDTLGAGALGLRDPEPAGFEGGLDVGAVKPFGYQFQYLHVIPSSN